MYEGFGLNLALSHMITAEDDNTEFISTLQLVQIIVLSVILSCDGDSHVKLPTII